MKLRSEKLGDTLSGGEKQRLGLARAFLHNAPFILLDEPTSNLDSLNEAVILKSLHQASDDKTVVLISHRASTMKIADDVYNVERGKDELMKTVQTKREREKRMVTEMINCIVKSSITQKAEHYVLSVMS